MLTIIILAMNLLAVINLAINLLAIINFAGARYHESSYNNKSVINPAAPVESCGCCCVLLRLVGIQRLDKCQRPPLPIVPREQEGQNTSSDSSDSKQVRSRRLDYLERFQIDTPRDLPCLESRGAPGPTGVARRELQAGGPGGPAAARRRR